MKRLVQRFSVCMLLVFAILNNAVSQISLTATLGTTSASYTTLNAAFAKINDGTHKGSITISVTGSTNEGTTAATLNASGSGSASYTAVSIGIPSGSATISGTVISSGSALIVLNGATNVVIDGRVSGAGNHLTLRNTYSSAVSAKPTILFTGGASNCTIQNCTIENNGTSGGAGVVTFSTGSNTSIDIAYNNIGDATGGTTGSPYCGIYGADNTNNSNISIYNNNIYDFISYGIYFYNGGDALTITNNNIYNTTSQGTPQSGISLGTDGGTAYSGSGHTISGNYIGGQAASCLGSAWAHTSYGFYGIYLNVGVTNSSSVTSNQVGNINMSGSIDANIFRGIQIQGGKVTVGSSGYGNVIGHATDNTKGVTNAGTSTTIGIEVIGGPVDVQYNTIRYLTASNSSAAPQVIGINLQYSTGTYLQNNTVKELSTASLGTGTALSSSAIGIRATFNPSPVAYIRNNTISNISNTAGSNAVSVVGLLCDLRSNAYFVEKNNISGLTAATGAVAVINGIYAYANTGNCQYANNMVSLGSSISNSYSISGIVDNAGVSNVNDAYYFNTVNIGGSSVTGLTNTYALNSSLTTTRAYKDNIFVNARSNGTGAGKHYAVKYGSSGTYTADYNNYVASGTGAVFGYYGADVANLAAWKTATSKDANSISRPVNFVSSTDLHLAGASIGDVNLTGTPISGITTDYDGITRHAAYPYMGADESTTPLPVELTGFAAIAKDRSVTLHWATATETNNYGFEIECRVKAEDDRRLSWAKVAFVEGHGTTNAPQNYSYSDKPGEGKYQYRLKQIDRDGRFEYSNSVEVATAAPIVFALEQNYPNPFNPATSITFTVPANGHATLKVFNTIGQEVATLFHGEAQAGIYNRVQFNASDFTSGLYFSRLEYDGKVQMKRMALLK